jgi:hypothetical protein
MKGTTAKPIVISCRDKLNLECFCDASYGTHTDGKSHTGFVFTMGSAHSYLHARSFKQKLTALSSTDAEVLAATTAATTAVWLRELVNEIMCGRQEHFVHHVTLYQDNQSGIWLITNPAKYRRSKHILTKISYLKDLINSRILEVKHLSTDQMPADTLTKPLQGNAFNRHNNFIMK